MQKEKKKQNNPGSFQPLSFQNVLHASTAASKSQLLEGRQLCREAHCQQDSPCPRDTRCPGRELRHDTAQCWPPTTTALGCINLRTLGQVCHWTGTNTSTTAPDGDCIQPQHAHKYILSPTNKIYMGKLQFYQYLRLEIFHSCLGEGIAGQPASSATNYDHGWDASCLSSTPGAPPWQQIWLSPKEAA